MTGFANVLFCPLGHEYNLPALRRVVSLLDPDRATLTLLGHVHDPSPLQRMLGRQKRLDAAAEEARQGERKRLTSWVSRLDTDAAHVETQVRVGSGSPAISIIEHVLRFDHDLVVVTSDDDREDAATIKRLLRKCPTPVWVIRRTRARIPRILVAVNPEPEERDLNLAVLRLGALMHELHGGELHVVHVWQLYGEATMRTSAFMRVPEEEVDEMLREEESVRSNALRKLLAEPSVADAPWQVHLRKGRPAEAVVETVEKNRINLLVLGTVARSGVPGLVMGNTAEAILDEVSCSVVAVKPPDFHTPVTLPT